MQLQVKVLDVDTKADGSQAVNCATQISFTVNGQAVTQELQYARFTLQVAKDSPLLNSFTAGTTIS